MLPRGKSTDETDVAWLFFHNHNHCFWFCSSWSYFAFKTNKKRAQPWWCKNTFFIFVCFATRLLQPQTAFYFYFPQNTNKNRASELPSDRSTERPIDRAIQRLLFSNCFFIWQHILATLITTRCSERATKRSNKLSHTGRFPLMGWWGIAKRIEYTYGFLYVYVYVYVLVYVLMYVYVSICT